MELQDQRLSLTSLRIILGQTDVYLLDQIMKGRLATNARVLDAGCGGGRNMELLVRCGVEVYGIDQAEDAVQSARRAARLIDPGIPEDRFRVAPVNQMPFSDQAFDFVIANAVLHFARDRAHWEGMVHELWRVLRPGGTLFTRLMSTDGIEERVQEIGDGVYRLPAGPEVFLVNMSLLEEWTARLGGTLADPIKTVNVHNQRCMTTWVLTKPG